MVPQLRVLLVVVVIGCALRGADASAESKANEYKEVYVKIVQEGQGEGKDCDEKANDLNRRLASDAGKTGKEIANEWIAIRNTDKKAEGSIKDLLRMFTGEEKDTKKTRCIAKKELVCADNKCVKCSAAKQADHKQAKDFCGAIEKIAKAGGGMKTPMMAVGTILVALLAFFSSQ